MKTLPEQKILTLDGKRIAIIHGFGPPAGLPERLLKLFEKIDCLVFGHSHQPMNEYRNGVLLFNPGSPTDKRYAPYKSYGILEVNENGIKGEIFSVP